jgi:predicted nucleic acid-binding protein
MGQYLIDNNVISNYFSGLFPEKAMDFVADVIDQTPNISVITEIEALSWCNPDDSKEAVVKAFVEDANILTLSRDVVAQCVKIRRSRKVRTPDAIIAATAIVHNLTLITNDSDFNNIQGLKLIDPHGL